MPDKILLIEDETARVEQAVSWFGNLGYQVVWAATPYQIRYYLRQGFWKLICWDNDLGVEDRDGVLCEGVHIAQSEYGADAVSCGAAIWIWSRNTTQAPKIERALWDHVADLDMGWRPIIVREPFGTTIPARIQFWLMDTEAPDAV